MWCEIALWVALALGPILFGAVEPWSLFALEGAILLAALGVFLIGRPRWRFALANPVSWALLAAVALGTLQLATARPVLGPQTALLSTVDPGATRAAVLLAASYGVFLASLSFVLTRAGAPRRLAWVLFLLAATVAAIGLVQDAQGDTLIYWIRAVAPDRRPFGPFYNRDDAASLLAMAAPIGTGLLVARLSQWKRQLEPSQKADIAAQAVLCLLPLAAILGGLYAIRSRGALAGLVGAAAVVGLLVAVKTKRAAFGIMLGLAALAATGAPSVARRLRALPIYDGASVATRVSMYRSSAKIIEDSPLFGIGLGALRTGFAPYRDRSLPAIVDHVHSDWLEAAVESGLPGAAAAFCCLALFAIAVARRTKEADLDSMAIALGALAAALTGAFHALVDFNLRIPGDAVFFLAACSLAYGAVRPAAASAPASRSFAALPAAVLAALCAAAIPDVSGALRAGRVLGEPRLVATQRFALETGNYRFAEAYVCWAAARAHPERATPLLHEALDQASAGLEFDSASVFGNHVMASILADLGRMQDARFYYSRSLSAGT